MPLQRFTIGRMPGLAKVVRGIIAMLRFFGVVRSTTTPLAPCGPERMTMPLLTHPSKTLLTISLINKQVVPYRTCGDTCCSGVSTPKILSLADSNMTNHKP
jgi:hypothetical protein